MTTLAPSDKPPCRAAQRGVRPHGRWALQRWPGQHLEHHALLLVGRLHDKAALPVILEASGKATEGMGPLLRLFGAVALHVRQHAARRYRVMERRGNWTLRAGGLLASKTG